MKSNNYNDILKNELQTLAYFFRCDKLLLNNCTYTMLAQIVTVL